jgi:hypothetical protein
MTTAFNRMDRVIATASVQGMQAGASYTVAEVHEQQTPFGNFVTYEITDGTERLFVRNAHLLLDRAP